MGEQSTRDPRSPVAQSIEQAGQRHRFGIWPAHSRCALPAKASRSASEKEAAMASPQAIEKSPVPLNGGGFG